MKMKEPLTLLNRLQLARALVVSPSLIAYLFSEDRLPAPTAVDVKGSPLWDLELLPSLRTAILGGNTGKMKT